MPYAPVPGPLRSGSAIVLCALLAVTVAGATDLPPNYEESDVLPPNVHGVRNFTWAPDGTMFVAASNGTLGNRIFRWADDVLTELINMGDTPTDERGLANIEVDPDFEQNSYLWVHYTYQGGVEDTNRVSRFTVSGDQLVDEVVFVETPPLSSSKHKGGCFYFDAAKTLFIGFGDDLQYEATAQNPFDLRGKVLRIERDGSGVADNPYADGVAGDPRIWMSGFRNPYRCAVQPGTETLFIGEVGSWKYEEINYGIHGSNAGWPDQEGDEVHGVPGATYPAYNYPSRLGDGTGAAVIPGDFAKAGDLEPAYEGNLFFSDRIRREIHRMILDENQRPVSVELWAVIDTPHLTNLEFGPDGALYYAAGGTVTNIRRIVYAPGANLQPTALGHATPPAGAAPLQVTLDGTASFDPDDDPLTHRWEIGDGGIVVGATVNHTYPLGVYEAKLTVLDGGLNDTSPPIRIVSGNEPPTAAITAPAPATTYDAGDVVSYSGSGSDPEDGTPPCSDFRWQVLVHYDGKSKPFLGPIEGSCASSFTTATRGVAAPDAFYRILLDVRDSGAPIGPDAVLTASDVIDVHPNVSTLSFQSAPQPDLQLTIDGEPFTPPVVLDGVVGFIREIGVVDGQTDGGHTWSWVDWSDGGDQTHEITTTAAPSSFTATFGCDVIVEVEDLALSRGVGDQLQLGWQPVTDTCLAGGAESYRIYAASSPVPATGTGTFPVDPAYTLVGTTGQTSFTYSPAADERFFLVVAMGTDQLDGVVGHYGE